MGYYRLPNDPTGTPEGFLNINRPIMGDAFLEFTGLAAYERKISPRISCRLHLNIANPPGFDNLPLCGVDTGSNAVFGQQYAHVPSCGELRRPRNLKLFATIAH